MLEEKRNKKGSSSVDERIIPRLDFGLLRGFGDSVRELADWSFKRELLHFLSDYGANKVDEEIEQIISLESVDVGERFLNVFENRME